MFYLLQKQERSAEVLKDVVGFATGGATKAPAVVSVRANAVQRGEDVNKTSEVLMNGDLKKENSRGEVSSLLTPL